MAEAWGKQFDPVCLQKGGLESGRSPDAEQRNQSVDASLWKLQRLDESEETHRNTQGGLGRKEEEIGRGNSYQGWYTWSFFRMGEWSRWPLEVLSNHTFLFYAFVAGGVLFNCVSSWGKRELADLEREDPGHPRGLCTNSRKCSKVVRKLMQGNEYYYLSFV